MKNSNYKFQRFFIIISNFFVFMSVFFFLALITFCMLAELKQSSWQLTNFDDSFRSVISVAIKNGYFPLVAVVIYIAAMQLIYSFLNMRWSWSLEDEQFLKHRWLILIYSFFNMTFFVALMLNLSNQKTIDTGIRVKRKMALHESSVFALSGSILFLFSLVLLAKNQDYLASNLKNTFVITMTVAIVLLVIGIIGLVSISKIKSNMLSVTNELKNFPVHRFSDLIAKIMVAFNLVFVLTKMILLLIINTIGYLSSMFDNSRNRGLLGRLSSILNLVVMYTLVFQVFKALSQKDDEPLVIDLTNNYSEKRSF